MSDVFSCARLATVDALQRVIDAVPNPMFVKDFRHRFVILNEAHDTFVGIPGEQLLGKSDFDVVPPEQAEIFQERDRALLATGLASEHEEQHTDKSGQLRTILTRKSIVHIGEGEDNAFIVGVISDITEFRDAEARAHHLALHDVLTGVGNRASLSTQLRQAIGHAERTRERLAVLCLDLDRFKAVNDLFGHAAGDEVLRIAARRLQGTLRPRDAAARLGGDEFAVVQTGLDRPEDAEILAGRIVDALSAEYQLSSGQAVNVSASVGISLFPDDGQDTDTLLSRADAALYRIKSNGRNGFAFFHAGMDTDIRARRALEHDIRLALGRRELSLVYQAQCDTATRQVLGFEALLRWTHPQRGNVPPDLFIPAAETCGAIIAIGAWVIREACREAASWPSAKLRIAVNVSPAQIHQGDLARTVQDALDETGLDPARLELEVTEGIVIRDRELALRAMQRLKQLGVGLALDDFGTGYSSLSTLSAFPFDRVKVDRSFIRDLSSSREAQTIVRAVLGLGRGLGLPVVAEGVETEAQLAELRRQGCDEVQGYLMSKPQAIGAYRLVTAG